MLQAQKEAQQSFLGLAEVGHVRATLRPTKRRRQGNNQQFQKVVPCIGRARVSHPAKAPSELDHPTPSVLRESSSESILPANAT
jgi:hypothetical protein